MWSENITFLYVEENVEILKFRELVIQKQFLNQKESFAGVTWRFS